MGRIPVLVDALHKDDLHPEGKPVAETGAILLHMAESQDTAKHFWFAPREPEWSDGVQWLFRMVGFRRSGIDVYGV